MTRRLACDDWITIALSDLKEEKKYLEDYGVEEYFEKSIKALENMDAARSATATKSETASV